MISLNVDNIFDISALNIELMTASVKITFLVKIFLKYVLLCQLKNPSANFEWIVPLICNIWDGMEFVRYVTTCCRF